MYTQGFKASTKVTENGKAALRAALPPSATAAFDHRLSRYLKKVIGGWGEPGGLECKARWAGLPTPLLPPTRPQP